jgi:Tfp pilus assembly protein PilN
MIDINLVPPQLRTNMRKSGLQAINIPQEILLGFGGVLVVIILCIHLALGVSMVGAMTYHQGLKREWEALQPDKQNLDKLASQTKDLKKKMDTLRELTSKQSIVWSKNFNTISDLLPDSVWLRRIYVEPAGLFLEGSAYSPTENEINTVSLFINALKKDEAFMKGFSSLEVNSISTSKRKSTEVTDFVAAAKLK